MLTLVRRLAARLFRPNPPAPATSFSAMQQEAKVRAKAKAAPHEFLQAHGWLPCESPAAATPETPPARVNVARADARRLLS